MNNVFFSSVFVGFVYFPIQGLSTTVQRNNQNINYALMIIIIEIEIVNMKQTTIMKP